MIFLKCACSTPMEIESGIIDPDKRIIHPFWLKVDCSILCKCMRHLEVFTNGIYFVFSLEIFIYGKVSIIHLFLTWKFWSFKILFSVFFLAFNGLTVILHLYFPRLDSLICFVNSLIFWNIHKINIRWSLKDWFSSTTMHTNQNFIRILA